MLLKIFETAHLALSTVPNVHANSASMEIELILRMRILERWKSTICRNELLYSTKFHNHRTSVYARKLLCLIRSTKVSPTHVLTCREYYFTRSLRRFTMPLNRGYLRTDELRWLEPNFRKLRYGFWMLEINIRRMLLKSKSWNTRLRMQRRQLQKDCLVHFFRFIISV